MKKGRPKKTIPSLKKTNAKNHFRKFLESLGFKDLGYKNLENIAEEVFTTYTQKLFSGLYEKLPEIEAISNQEGYENITFYMNVPFISIHEKNFLPFFGKVHIAYIPSKNGFIIKNIHDLNKIVEYFSKKLQTQERLIFEIHEYVNKKCEKNFGVAVLVEFFDISSFIEKGNHKTIYKVSKFSGNFLTDSKRLEEFYSLVNNLKNE